MALRCKEWQARVKKRAMEVIKEWSRSYHELNERELQMLKDFKWALRD